MTSVAESIVGRKVDVIASEVVAFSWDAPPRRGTVLLVDGVRCRVTYARVVWDGPRWELRSLWVKEVPA